MNGRMEGLDTNLKVSSALGALPIIFNVFIFEQANVVSLIAGGCDEASIVEEKIIRVKMTSLAAVTTAG